MKCIIPGANIKVFGKAIHSLSKIGEELYLEPLEHGLALRTVNVARSAYGCFVFAPEFFYHYDNSWSGPEGEMGEEEETFKCKIQMKSVLAVFRSLPTLERTVDRCKVTLDEGPRLVFQLYCKHSITKTYNLTFQECETLQAVFSKDLCPNAITAQPKLLTEVVQNFQVSLEEITLIVSPEKVILKNYVESEPDPSKVLHTQMSLAAEEFDYFQIGVDTELTFCLKELRAILAFAEAAGMPISLHFETSGKPIVFSLEGDPAFDSNFVMATLADLGSTQGSQSSQQQALNRPSTSKTKRTAKRTQQQTRRNESGMMENRRFQENRQPNRSCAGGGSFLPMDSGFDDMMNDGMDDVMAMGANEMEEALSQEAAQQRNGTSLHEASPERSGSPEIPLELGKRPRAHYPEEKPTSHDQSHDDVSMVMEEEEQEQEDLVPGTPPSKRFRSMFFGISSQSQATQAPTDTAEVLCEDTDDED
ncbi:PREDICTED: cell cycle checkpoint control protein RAD9A-like [Branchiostoma belcheri]|uniref:Cell cycle checkpoint control protein n=1 Tax=Branchiostoma belcheri TaxID=7741 RepID=A0A6P5AUB0_BRABE|nr:PREDICTED: cell cycle checkpoint control protein RAD9A-like [Branchiostoma belcheri]